MKFSIVIPCHNEETSIASVITSLPREAYEIIVVDNNSTDDTATIARTLGARVVLEPRKGYGNALKTGFAHTKSDIIVTFDADGQHPADKILEMVNYLIAHQLDFLSGNRFPQGANEISFIRIFGNKALTIIGNLLFGLDINDSQCGMWVLKRDLLSHITLEDNDMALSHEIKIKAFSHPTLRAQEYPISFRDRLGNSKLSIISHGIKNLILLLRLRFSSPASHYKSEPRIIVGIKSLGDGFHDNSVALLRDTTILFVASEERYSRIKHDGSFPAKALDAALRYTKLSPDDIDIIALGYPRSNMLSLGVSRFGYEIVVSVAKLFLRRGIFFLSDVAKIVRGQRKQRLISQDAMLLGKSRVYVDHHLAHAASAYYTSGYSSCFVIVLDAFGPDARGRLRAGALYIGHEGTLKEIMSVPLWASLGLFYQSVTLALGFTPGDGEGKTMGLAAFGDPKKAYHSLRPFAPHFKDGAWHRGKYWFDGIFSSQCQYSPIFFATSLGRALKHIINTYKKEDVAAAAQRILEKECMSLASYVSKQYPNLNQIALAGGVFLNVKGNKKIREILGIREVFVHPHAADGGTALGAAFVVASQYHTFFPKPLLSAGLGDSFSDKEIQDTLKPCKDIAYQRHADIAGYAATKLIEGKVIGWFQGRAEWGPRALGFRSVLADPRDAKVKDRINQVLKNREWFMPFAPSILQEYAPRYFKDCYHSPFMTMVYEVREGKEKEIPAAIHVDNTARPHTVSKESNPLYYDLINAFYKETGVPVILNTSFNRHGLPIVNNPREAVEHLLWGAVDELIIGNYAAAKKV